ncbi:MAG TPA: carboxylesterase/lipase family protein [Candidatus Binataceae bacterium]|nr:carboxylesterase/lipase family protein [Candidatus Binataceae bacterium]
MNRRANTIVQMGFACAVLVSAAIFCALLTSAPANATISNPLIVTTKNGRVRGALVGGVREFLGVPYATAPTGTLRWQPTQPPANWPGILQTLQFGSACPQLAATGVEFGDENCLFLNVYIPPSTGRSRTGLPVMVWIHGGGLVEGSGEDYDPTPLVKQSVIVVTINYRLGLLGFFAQTALDAEGHLAGNYGFLDQQMALKWVRRNISAFGGNPRRVTIFGESAGGQSVYSQLASPLAKGLFRGAIAESGSYGSFTDYFVPIIPLAQGETLGSTVVQSGAAFAAAVGCGDQTAACLRAVPAATLVGVQPSPAMYPFVDGAILTQTPTAAFASGQFNQVPVIVGTNHDEYRLFVALDYDYLGNPLTNANYSAAVTTLWGPLLAPSVLAVYPLPSNPPADAASLALGANGTDGIFSCPARTGDQSLAQFVPTYTYEFSDENAPLGLLPPASFPLGAYHSAEIQYLMTVGGIPATFTPDQQALSAAMISYWTQFAKNGDPNSAAQPLWAPYSSTTDEFQSFVPPTPVVDSIFATDHICTDFWDTF